jgi:hypothetical protein
VPLVPNSVRGLSIRIGPREPLIPREYKMIQSVAMILLGVWFFLIGMGKAKVSKNPEANDQFVAKWGKLFLVAGPVMILAGVVLAIQST